MANAIETELLEATGLKKKVGETFQKLAARLVAAVQEIAEDDWDKLSDEAQAWVNAGSKAINADKDVARFPADEEPAEEDEPEEKPARGRGRGKAAEEEEPEDEPEDKPRRGRRAAAEEEPEDEPDEKPARGRGRRAAAAEEEDEPDEKPARGRRSRAEPEEDEPEDKPARTRTRTRAAAEEDDEKPARKAAKKETKPTGRSSGKADVKAPSATTLLKKMLMKNPKMSTDEILAELEDKHGLTPTPMAISSIRSAFIHSMKILNDAGHLGDKMAAKLP